MIDHTLTTKRFDMNRPQIPARTRVVDEQELTPQQSMKVAEDWIGKHPVLCVGVARTAGAILGCLIKRR